MTGKIWMTSLDILLVLINVIPLLSAFYFVFFRSGSRQRPYGTNESKAQEIKGQGKEKEVQWKGTDEKGDIASVNNIPFQKVENESKVVTMDKFRKKMKLKKEKEEQGVVSPLVKSGWFPAGRAGGGGAEVGVVESADEIVLDTDEKGEKGEKGHWCVRRGNRRLRRQFREPLRRQEGQETEER